MIDPKVVPLHYESEWHDDSDNGNYKKSLIVGTWEIKEVKTTEAGMYVDWPFERTYASFKSDCTYYGSGYFGTGRGTWPLKGNTVKTYVDGKLYASYTIISATSTASEMKMSFGEKSIWVKCKKQ